MSIDREKLNRVFWDLGLRFEWDEATWATLAPLPDLKAQLRTYLEKHQPHLLAVYDIDFLVKIIEEKIANPTDSRTGLEAHRSV